MLEKIKTSCLTAKHAARLRLEPFTEGHRLPVNPSWAGFKIPYFNLKGKELPFFRFRYTQVKPSKGFLSVAEDPEKPLRYSQPKGSECHVYFPPLIPGDWEEVSQNATVSVCITEGELKAACGCAQGIPTMGLGGVFNWRSARLQQSLVPVLECWMWAGRKVYLCFDSDSATNPMVRQAAARLAIVLLNRGAVVHEIELPPGPERSKQGMDDYIFRHGVEAFGALIAAATPAAASAALHQLNLEVALVRATNEIVHLSTGNVMSAHQFIEVAYKDRKYEEFITKKKKKTSQEEDEEETPKSKICYAAREWMEWPQRAAVPKLVYQPGADRFTSDGAYNTWPGWGCQPSAEGTVAPWEDLVYHVMAGAAEEHVLWLKRWLAYPLRHPGTKLFSAVLVWGYLQGTGKTLLGETMAEIYGANYRTISSADLVSPYNDWVVGHQFIVGDEISVGGQARKITDNLKDIISRTTAVVNLKYRAQYTVKDCNNYYFTSNHAEALFIEDADRRYFVHEVLSQPLRPAQYRAYTRWLRQEGGAARLFHYLAEELDMGDFDPLAAPPVTEAKRDMVVYNRSELDAWCAVVAATPEAVIKSAGAALPYELFTAAELHKIFDPDNGRRYSTNAVSRALKKAGVKQAAHGDNKIVVDGARVRLWAVRQGAKWWMATSSKAQAAYEAERDAYRRVGGAARKERVM